MDIRDKINIPIRNVPEESDQSQTTDSKPADASGESNLADTLEPFGELSTLPDNYVPPPGTAIGTEETAVPAQFEMGTALLSTPDPVDARIEGVGQEPQHVRDGNPLNPYLPLFESPALDPQAMPGQGSVAPGGTAFPDKLTSVNPRETLPVNSQIDSVNLKGLPNLKIAPDHFGIDLSAGGLKESDVLNQILGFGTTGGSSGGLHIEGLGKFNLGKNWSLMSDGTSTSYGDEKNGGYKSTGTDPISKARVTKEVDWTTDSNGVYHYSNKSTEDYGDGNKVETVLGGDGKSLTNYVQSKLYYKNDELVRQETTTFLPDGSFRTDVSDGDGNAMFYTITKTEEGVTTVKTYDPDGTYQGKQVTSQDGSIRTYDDKGNEVKYTNPDADPTVTGDLGNLTPEEFLRIQNLRQGVNTMPSNTDDQQPIAIDPNRVFDPMTKPLVTDGNPEYESQIFSDPNLDVRNSAQGGDTVNPNEDAAPQPPPTSPPGSDK